MVGRVTQSSAQTDHFLKALTGTFYIKTYKNTPETEGRGRIGSGARTLPKFNVHPPPFSSPGLNSALLSQGTPVDGMMSHL